MGGEQAGVVSERLATRIPGFDEIANGGLPRHGVTVVVGGVGTGKTIFGMQVLSAGARNGEPGILVAFEESAARIRANTNAFAWGGIPGDGVCILDAQLAQLRAGAVTEAGDRAEEVDELLVRRRADLESVPEAKPSDRPS